MQCFRTLPRDFLQEDGMTSLGHSDLNVSGDVLKWLNTFANQRPLFRFFGALRNASANFLLDYRAQGLLPYSKAALLDGVATANKETTDLIKVFESLEGAGQSMAIAKGCYGQLAKSATPLTSLLGQSVLYLLPALEGKSRRNGGLNNELRQSSQLVHRLYHQSRQCQAIPMIFNTCCTVPKWLKQCKLDVMLSRLNHLVDVVHSIRNDVCSPVIDALCKESISILAANHSCAQALILGQSQQQAVRKVILQSQGVDSEPDLTKVLSQLSVSVIHFDTGHYDMALESSKKLRAVGKKFGMENSTFPMNILFLVNNIFFRHVQVKILIKEGHAKGEKRQSFYNLFQQAEELWVEWLGGNWDDWHNDELTYDLALVFWAAFLNEGPSGVHQLLREAGRVLLQRGQLQCLPVALDIFSDLLKVSGEAVSCCEVLILGLLVTEVVISTDDFWLAQGQDENIQHTMKKAKELLPHMAVLHPFLQREKALRKLLATPGNPQPLFRSMLEMASCCEEFGFTRASHLFHEDFATLWMHFMSH